MRLCLVSPYAWDRPSEANDHLASHARTLAARGHEVVVLAPARKPALLLEGRRRLHALGRGDATALAVTPGTPLVVGIGLALPISTGAAGRSVPIPVAVAAGVRLVLARGGFDAVDALDPDQPGASAVALRESPAAVVATFFRAGPTLRTARGAERLAGAADAVVAVSAVTAAAILQRFGLQATVTGVSVDAARFAPAPPVTPPLVAVEATLADGGALRALFAELEATGAEIALLRSAGAAALRPLVPAALRGRVRLPDASTPAARATVLRGATAFIAARAGSPLIPREAAACGVPVIAVAGSQGAEDVRHEVDGLIAQTGQPALLAACAGRLLADSAEAVYAAGRPRRPIRPPTDGERILCDFHMHSEYSHDCTTPIAEVVERALAAGLGAIAVTDHNTIAGGVAARHHVAAHGLDLHVVVGSEIKTTTGEVIGLYLKEEIPRGMEFATTVEAIRAQGGVVYVPHPFDRLHAVPDPALLRRLVDQIDVIEACNGRLYREAFNRQARAFAERHDVLIGAGSDAHVGEGIGTAALDLPRFSDPESLLVALGDAQIVRRPASVLYLQSLKWLRGARSRARGAES
jgi:predicted metal-dependent phosphoesterase TrpH